MPPELKTACEVVFQEHKVSAQPIKWNRDAFRGRISIGLSAMAKETLVKKNIIFLPDKSKKIITLLNPAVATAASFEEAEAIIENKAEAAVTSVRVDHTPYMTRQTSGATIPRPAYSHQLLSIAGEPQTQVAQTALTKWYMKPLFFYVVWPFCAAVAGAAISYLLDFSYTKLFLDWK
jgi:hypothetical protein